VSVDECQFRMRGQDLFRYRFILTTRSQASDASRGKCNVRSPTQVCVARTRGDSFRGWHFCLSRARSIKPDDPLLFLTQTACNLLCEWQRFRRSLPTNLDIKDGDVTRLTRDPTPVLQAPYTFVRGSDLPKRVSGKLLGWNRCRP
jgi:hypothetical protein